jgi:hypothetical protein
MRNILDNIVGGVRIPYMSLKRHKNLSWRQSHDHGIVMLDFEDFGFSIVFIGRPYNF